MVSKKRSSKRLGLHGKYKVERKVKEHHRKLKRARTRDASLVAKHKKQLKHKLAHSARVPNSAPFKDDVLAEVAEERARAEREKEARKERARINREAKRPKTVEELAAEAARRAGLHENALAGAAGRLRGDGGGVVVEPDHNLVHGDSTRKFYRDFRKVVESSDVVLEVLDARDPMGCRCPEIEQRILAADPNKRIVLVLNKIDLVPREVAEKWLAVLRNEYPTLVFKSNTQSQKSNLSQGRKKKVFGKSTGRMPRGTPSQPEWAARAAAEAGDAAALRSSECVGAPALIQLLKNYSRNHKIKTAITVGVIGYPNVGKSSLINSLKRSKAANVGNSAGVTKSIQEVLIDSKIKILDCPGIVFASGGDEANVILRNAVKVQKLTDPIPPVRAILARCDTERLCEIYGIPEFSTAEEFLFEIGRRQGRLLRGGVPDVLSAGRTVINDWNTGKIPFYTEPPASMFVSASKSKKGGKGAKGTTPAASGYIVTSEVVNEWAAAFDLDSVNAEQDRMVKVLMPLKETEAMKVDAEDIQESNMFDEDEADILPGNKVDEDEDDYDEEYYESDDEMSADDMNDEDEDEDDDEESDEESDDDAGDNNMMTGRKMTSKMMKRAGRTNAQKMMEQDEAEINPQVNQSRKRLAKQMKKRNAKGRM